MPAAPRCPGSLPSPPPIPLFSAEKSPPDSVSLETSHLGELWLQGDKLSISKSHPFPKTEALGHISLQTLGLFRLPAACGGDRLAREMGPEAMGGVGTGGGCLGFGSTPPPPARLWSLNIQVFHTAWGARGLEGSPHVLETGHSVLS